MKSIKKEIPTLIGLIATTALAAISGGLVNPAVTPILGMLGSAGSGIGASLAANFLTKFTPAKIKKYFVDIHPNDLNHNIKKLFFKSINEALHNIYVLFSETQASENEQKQAKLLIETLQKKLHNILLSTNQIQLDELEVKHFLYEKDKEDNICNFINEQFEKFGIVEPFKSFLAQNLPIQIQLCFGEGLKDPANQNAWIAFQRMLIEEIRNDIKQIADDISDLKFEKSGFSEEQIAEIHQLIKILNDKKLVEVKIKSGINQSLDSIKNKANEIIRITTKTQLTVDELKIIIEKIKRQNRINHIIIYAFATCLLIVGVFVVYKLMNQPFTATIQVVDWKGNDNSFVFEDCKSKLIIDEIGFEKGGYEINSNREVIIPEVSAKYKNQNVKVKFQDSYMYLKDTVIKLKKGEKSKLQLYLWGLDKIRGNIKDDETGIRIDGALILINGQNTYSDSLGNFEMSFLPNKQEINQIIEIYKTNYDRYYDKVDMRTNIYNPVPFRLHRSNNIIK